MIARRRLRYSVRTLLLSSTLICLALATWAACRTRAISDVSNHANGWSPEVVAPFLLRTHFSDNVTAHDTFHVWAFGCVLSLPFKSAYPEPNPTIITVQPRIIFNPEPEQRQLGFQLRQ
ncbi:hypothetical protein K239x_25680 [Planctomycetes bacterium K23_9]|uniref:Uncharacterized protein n=1 Tax=Stieleria marina TaxID=1930275 RepID=A0A517NU17_9BACT|nr:hypothetical protein K239x_25680 [Planctomycetes bacterium K23_9]